MRVLVLNDKKNNVFAVYEIIDLFYVYELSALVFKTIDGYYFNIPDIHIDLFNVLCKDINLNGYLDLSLYHEKLEYDNWDDEEGEV